MQVCGDGNCISLALLVMGERMHAIERPEILFSCQFLCTKAHDLLMPSIVSNT